MKTRTHWLLSVVAVAAVHSTACTSKDGSPQPTAPFSAGQPIPTEQAKEQPVHLSEEEATAVTAVNEAGGRVFIGRNPAGEPALTVLFSRIARDVDLQPLVHMPHLSVLALDQSFITDAGLVFLHGARHLRAIDLRFTKITDAGLAHLIELRQLQLLALVNTKITDAGLKYVAGLNQLRILRLGFTSITDAGLEHLQALDGLQELDLRSTAVTDSGLERLQHLKGLRELSLSETLVTPAGVRGLAVALPQLKITQ